MDDSALNIKQEYYTVQVSFGTMPWGFTIKCALTYMFQPILLPVLIIASKLSGKSIKV